MQPEVNLHVRISFRSPNAVEYWQRKVGQMQQNVLECKGNYVVKCWYLVIAQRQKQHVENVGKNKDNEEYMYHKMR